MGEHVQRMQKRSQEIQTQWQALSTEWGALATELQVMDAQRQQQSTRVEELRRESWRQHDRIEVWKKQHALNVQAHKASQDACHSAAGTLAVAATAQLPPQVRSPGMSQHPLPPFRT